jgi:signal transduction histidine kinase
VNESIPPLTPAGTDLKFTGSGSNGTTGDNGNLQSQMIQVPTSMNTQTYVYDGVNRLMTFTENGSVLQGYTYDSAGVGYGNRWISSGTFLPYSTQTHGFSHPRKYREECEREGQDLARGGVPAECAATAVDFYVESCLPYLNSGDRREPHWRRALLRWASRYRFFLLAGYAQRAAAESQSMEERVNLAERRSQGFAVELGDAYEKERRRLAQDLHDEIGHDLIVLKLYTQVIALDMKKGDVGQLQRKLKEFVCSGPHFLDRKTTLS